MTVTCERVSSGGLLRIYLNGQTKVLGVGNLEKVSDGGDGGIVGQVFLGELRSVSILIRNQKQ